MAAALTAYSARAQVTYSPKQEQVPDFGALVPAHEVSDTLPWGEVVLERVTTAIPWGRGMATVDGHLFVLSRGRHRSEGGVDQSVVDRAGTLWRVDTSKIERVIPGEWAGQAVRNNVSVLAEPTSPPFYLYTYEDAAENDILMGRPYCSLAFDEASRNLFICAYSGAELSAGFRKHGTDAIYRYDLRDSNWHVVEQHDPNVVPREELKAVIPNNYYPHHNPKKNDPPHGWLNGPDGCAVVGDFLYATAKDNHMVVQYDLDGIRRHPDAGPPESRPVIQETMIIRYPDGEKEMEILGPSSVAVHDDYLYLGFRTSSIVVRVPLDDDGDIVRTRNGKVRGDLIAVFEPWDAEKKRSGNLYDIAMSPDGDLFVSMGQEGKVWRITPDPARPFYGHDQTERPTTTPPFLNMTELVGRKTGCNNVFVDESGYLYVSSRSNDTGEGVIHGTIYRAKLNPPTTDASAR
jgi:hypothetical protein